MSFEPVIAPLAKSHDYSFLSEEKERCARLQTGEWRMRVCKRERKCERGNKPRVEKQETEKERKKQKERWIEQTKLKKEQTSAPQGFPSFPSTFTSQPL